MPKEATGIVSSRITARGSVIAAVIACCGSVIVAIATRACPKQEQPGTNQSVSGARNVTAQGQHITINVSGDTTASSTGLPFEATWLSEARYLSPIGVDFRSGIGSAPPTGIYELIQLIYQGRQTNSYGCLRQYRDRILKVNPRFGYVNWLWGCILSRRFHQEEEASQAFLDATEQLKSVSQASPENPYPLLYLSLLCAELGNDDMSDWYFEESMRKSVHLQSQWLLPVEFDGRRLRKSETYSRWMTFLSLWEQHALGDRGIKPCDVTSVWLANCESERSKWHYEYDNGKWVHVIKFDVNLPDFPKPESARHYIDIELNGKGTLNLFGSVTNLLDYHHARMISTSEEHTRLSALPENVLGYGDPMIFACGFLNCLTNGLSSVKVYPLELGILKLHNTNEFFIGYCSTNFPSNGLVRLYLDKPADDAACVLALPATWLGQVQYKRPARSGADGSSEVTGAATGQHRNK